MARSALPIPRTERRLLDDQFIENRTRLLEIAAFLDRLDRAGADGAARDFRLRALREALQALCAATTDRVEQIQTLLSDPRPGPDEPAEVEAACGAYAGQDEEVR